jgi:hypothetical protein
MAEDLQKLDKDLIDSGMEKLALKFAMASLPKDTSERIKRNRSEFSIYALRVEVLRHLIGLPGFQAFSTTLAMSDVLTDFCGCRSIAGVKWTSKSSLQRASTFFSDEELRELNVLLIQATGNRASALQLGLSETEDLSICLIDTTCLKANIHFPVDWVLLRDVSITLLKAVTLIRNEGLLHRMPESPKQLIRQMNKLCIQMTHCRCKKGAPKARKAILRKMKALLRRIGKHAQKHRARLDCDYGQTCLSRAQADQVIARMDEKLALLPKVIQQAHERIIGGRLLKNEDKILSAHEPDIDVIVRGKADAQVEFGNELLIAESSGGLIVDYMLYDRSAPGEGEKLLESVDRQQSYEIEQSLEALVTDRGFDGKKTLGELKTKGITSYVCPKSPQLLKERLRESDFCCWQTRRGSTEARIAILKNHGGGRVWRAKGLGNRKLAVGWSVLAHNLAWVARKVRDQELNAPPKAA